MSEYDEFERFIRHQEFGKILDLAGRLKEHRSRLVTFASPDNNSAVATSSSHMALRTPRHKSSRLDAERNDLTQASYRDDGEVALSGGRPRSRRGGTPSAYHTPHAIESTADLIRSALIPAHDDHFDGTERIPSQRIGRGEYPITDSLIDETIKSLAEELSYCLDLKKQLNEAASDARVISPSATEEKGSPIAAKFSKWQTDILTEWMVEHREHPFPTHDEAKQLGRAAGLTQDQVLTWTVNARKKHIKMMLERQRKPRDFLDYLFLATDREKRILKDNPEKNLAFQNDRANIPDALLLASMPLSKSSASSVLGTSISKQTPKRSLTRSLQKASNTDPPRYTYPRPPSIQTHSSASVTRKSPSELMPPPTPRYNTYALEQQSHDPLNTDTQSYAKPYNAPPKNVDQIFRRGKRFHQLTAPKDNRESSDTAILYDNMQLPELPPASWSFGSVQNDESDSDREAKLRANEQRLIQKYTPNGIIETPEGSLDGSLDLGEIDDSLFDKYYLPPLSHEDTDIALRGIGSYTDDKPGVLHRADTFDVEEILAVPYDDYEKDYLSGLL
jgi:hypothetical protein